MPEPTVATTVRLGPGGPPTVGAGARFPYLAPPLAAGELGRLGGYRVLGVLGRGGMGVVFLAEDPHLERRVALKVLPPELADAEAKARFLREAKAQAAIDHDHVVAAHQVGEDRGVPFIAMPLLTGQTLAAALAEQGALPVAEVVRVGREAADGLAAAHDRGLMHRDVKPANLWLEGSRRRVKILDFGLARGTAPTARLGEPLTEQGITVGTPHYMAPEQAQGRPTDPRADLFSLGVVLYEAATGVRPFTGPDGMAVMAAVVTDTPPPPAAVNPAVPAALSELIVRLLAKDPAGRPASAAAVAAELRRIEGTGRWQASRKKRLRHAPRPARPDRRAVWLAAVGVSLTLAAAGAAVALLPVVLPRVAGGEFGPGTRLTDLALQAGGTVQLADGGTYAGGAALPPLPHHPTAVALDGVPAGDWAELFDTLCKTDTVARVELTACPVSDDELGHLTRDRIGGRLAALSLTDCPRVTAAGLVALGRLPELRRLTLTRCGLTPDQARELAAALPRCRIECDGAVTEPR
ncbi:MAG: protein kinase [Gemmataceae bacterium]